MIPKLYYVRLMLDYICCEKWTVFGRLLVNVDYLQDEERYSLVTATTEGGTIKIAAIDNGLAFPFKHPDEWRACMYNYKRFLAFLSLSLPPHC